MTAPDDAPIHVTDWGDLDALADVLGRLRGQAADAVEYARTWVARPDGFRTSAACLLQPLGEAMEQLGDALAALGDVVDADLGSLQEGVTHSRAWLSGTDAAAAASLPVVA